MTRATETAAKLDRAIDTILRSPHGPRALEDEGELVMTARVLRDALPRLHPRFSFEELLASRLAAARRRSETPLAEPTPIRPVAAVASDAPEDDVTDEPDPESMAERRRRGLVAGGAIASGVSLALPIAGVAIVAWRRSRSSGGIL